MEPIVAIKVVTYHCDVCHAPVARMQDGYLTILSKHHGNRHETNLRLPIVDKSKTTNIT